MNEIERIIEKLELVIALTNEERDIVVDILTRFVREIDETDEEKNNRWVPCNEALPAESGKYLVTYHEKSFGNYLPKYDDTYIKILHYQKSDRFTGWNFPRCVDDKAENDIVRECIAWQPLPEPHKDGK